MWDKSARLSQGYLGLALWAADSGQAVSQNLPEPYRSYFSSLFADLRTNIDNKYADMANGITGVTF